MIDQSIIMERLNALCIHMVRNPGDMTLIRAFDGIDVYIKPDFSIAVFREDGRDQGVKIRRETASRENLVSAIVEAYNEWPELYTIYRISRPWPNGMAPAL